MTAPLPPLVTEPIQTNEALLLGTFNRFYSVASFYPSGHTLCQEALAELYLAIERVVPAGEAMVLEPEHTGIRLQGKFLDQSHLGSEHFCTLLETLGLTRLKVKGNAPLEELHSMVTTMNTLKLEAGSSLDFHSLDFQALPDSIEIVQRKFGLRQVKLGPGNALSENFHEHINQLMKKVQEQSWSEEKKEEFRLLAETLLAKTVERMENGMVRSIQSQRNLEDVLLLGASVVEKAITSLEKIEDGRTVNQIFEQAAASLAYENDKDALEIIFEVLKGESDSQSAAEFGTADNPVPDETKYSQSISDLTVMVMNISAKAREPEISSSDYSLELLSVCLQMISNGVTGNHAESLRKILNKQLALPIGQPKIAVLDNALENLISAGDRTPIDHLLPLLIPHLIRNNSDAFAKFLNQAAPVDQPEKLAMIWPHMLELLLNAKPPRNPAMLEYLKKAVAGLPDKFVKEEAHRLDFMASVQSGKIGDTLLKMPLAQSHIALTALLQGRQGPQIGKRLNQTWMEKAPNKLAGVLVRVLGPYDSGQQKLYTTILEFSSSGILAGETRREISQLIRKSLGNLKKSERAALWVPHAVFELGYSDCPESRIFLQEIMNRKRMFFLHFWPAESRTSAKNAILKISEENGGARK